MAYAAVNSLKRTVERHIIPRNPQIMEKVYQTLKLLRNFLGRARSNAFRNTFRRAIDAFDAQLREAIWKLEDAVDSYVLHLSRPPPQGLGPVVDEERLQQEMDSFLETQQQLSREYTRKLEKYEEGEGEGEKVEATDAFGGKKSTAVGSSDRSGSGLDFFSVLGTKRYMKELETPWAEFGGKKSTTVGLSDQFKKIRYRLLNSGPGLYTISLMGMAGIGKTHLARKVYQDPIINKKFGCRAWVTAGPTAEVEAVLVEILAQIERKPPHLYTGKDADTLAALLKRKVHGCRFLIVLDDVWSTHISDYVIHNSLRYVNHWSRVLLTTRLEEVAKSHPTRRVYPIRFMNNEESWDLLSLNVFGEESFPPELEKAGRKIAEICEGLPLLILAVAEILCGLDKTEEHWNKVAAKKTTTFKDANDRISKVLYPSYEYLPEHLKACFLYMGVFCESSEVPLSKLINLMMVEDFLEPSQHGDLQYYPYVDSLEELVSNSVVLACKKSFDHRLKSCKLHTSYWYLCIKKARKSKFLHVLIKLTDASKFYIQGQRRVCVQNNMLFGIKEVYALVAAAALRARSLLFTGEDHRYPVPVCFELMFLKVLDALAIRFYEFPNEVVKLLRLRYLALTHNGKLPPSISNLQQLQCLILRRHHNIKFLSDHSTRLPIKIWHMQELTHLRITGSKLPDPSSSAKLPNLITLHVSSHSCTKAVFRGIPNLRKLGIKIELQPDGGETISCLNSIMVLGGLESLKCVVVNPRPRSQVIAPPHHLSNLPKSLQKLSLNGLGYSWKAMSAIGSLPNLKALKLRCFAFQGEEWETKVGKFASLEFLLLEDLDLLHLRIHGDNCFPSLRHLIVHHCFKLKMIPRQVGSIPSMEKIEIVDCSPSVVASAMKLKKYYGNSSLQVVIDSSWSR